MHHSGTLQVTLPSDREILMTRVFDAPRRLVFEALTRADLLRRWFGGPPGWHLDVCEIDARVGGKYSDFWHVAHLTNPRDVVPESNMPAYRFLARTALDTADLGRHLQAQRALGVPYTDAMIANAAADAFENLTLVKIPTSILQKCEWGRDDYSLNIQNLPQAEDDDAAEAAAQASGAGLPLFAGEAGDE